MCGIGGYLVYSGKAPDSPQHLMNAGRVLFARGPDGMNFFQKDTFGLVHTRLEIIAPGPEGRQPMQDSEGRWHLCFNGEILNYIELRNELIRDGISFQTHTDTEVLLQGLILYGKDFLSKVRGFFALALYDAHTRALYLARDHAGIKPLYLGLQSGIWYFASLPSAVKALGMRLYPDPQALEAYLEFHFFPPDVSGWKDLYPVAPGSWVKLQEGVKTETFWMPTHNIKTFSPQALYHTMERAVQRACVSDVPGGIFLSGGIDSGLLAQIIAKQGLSDLQSYTLAFDNTYLDESHAAAALSNRLGWKHTPVYLEDNTALQWLEKMEVPVGDPAGIGVFRLSQVASSEVKWVISGDGGDEIFGGYERYRYWKLLKYLPIPIPLPTFPSGSHRESVLFNIIRKINRGIGLVGQKKENRYRYLCSFNSTQRIQSLLVSHTNKDDFFSKWNPEDESMRAILDADFRFLLPGNMLPKTDLASMANGLEVRCPWLDEDICAGLRLAHDKYLYNKNLLYSAWEHFTQTRFTRTKRGLDIPLSKVFTGDTNALWMDLSHPDTTNKKDIFNPQMLNTLRNSKNQYELKWALLAWMNVMR